MGKIISFTSDVSTYYVGLDQADKLYMGTAVVYSGDSPTPPTPHDYSKDYLTTVALENGSIEYYNMSGGYYLSYSTDGGSTWSTPSNQIITVNVSEGDRVLWKGTNTATYYGDKFSSTSRYSVEGNPMSILAGDDFASVTTLPDMAFPCLFQDSDKLVSAENLYLGWETLSITCYALMFYGCSSLSAVTCLATDISAEMCTVSWLDGVAANGTFTKAANMSSWTSGADGIPNGWTVEDYNPTHDYSKDYLTFKALGDGTISFSGSSTANTVSYSTDGGSTWSTAERTPTVNVTIGDTVLWKGNCVPYNFTVGIGNFSATTVAFETEGNPASLLSADSFTSVSALPANAFAGLFQASTVVSVENLFLDFTISNYCFNSMFGSATALTTPPQLPATTVAQHSYRGMFGGCTSLTTAPALPATTLGTSCYVNMFGGCTSLTTAPELPASTLANDCYERMFRDCTSLVNAPSSIGDSATTMANSACTKMFSGCTALTTGPELPATTLANSCYNGMFSGCTSLSSITCLATNISASNCTSNWVNGVSASGTFTKAANMTSWATGVGGIPNGWTVQDAS